MAIHTYVAPTMKELSGSLLKIVGINLLTKSATEVRLKNNLLFQSEATTVSLTKVENSSDKSSLAFPESAPLVWPAHVWQYDNADHNADFLRCGSLKIGNAIVDTDFGNYTFLKDAFNSKKRTSLATKTLIAPWSHYWGGYYDLLTSIGPKLCRIEQAISKEDFEESTVSYPLLRTAYEDELLQLLGFKQPAIIDSRTHKIQFDSCLIGSSTDWFYPHPDDILRFKKEIENRLFVVATEPKRIYISRSGRRRILNEEALIALLVKYDFEIIEDRPRTIAEQVALYANASFIIGPHGASFTNILWCKPGTRLLELFSNQYVPDYYRYLSQLLELDYAAYCKGSVIGNDHRYVEENIRVSVDEIERTLQHFLEKSPA